MATVTWRSLAARSAAMTATTAIVQASALFLLVSEDQTPTAEGLRAALAQAAAPG